MLPLCRRALCCLCSFPHLVSFVLSSSRRLGVVSPSASHGCLLFLLPTSRPRGFGFLVLATFASWSKVLAIDFDVISQRASVILVSRCSCVIASTWPANLYASPKRAWAKEASFSSAAVEFHSVALVPSITILSLKESLLWSLSVFSCLV